MCGRYTLTTAAPQLAARFGIAPSRMAVQAGAGART